MWITLLLPVLCVSLVAALSVLVYSLQKSLGPIKLPSLVRAKTQQTQAPVTADSDPGAMRGFASLHPQITLRINLPGVACG